MVAARQASVNYTPRKAATMKSGILDLAGTRPLKPAEVPARGDVDARY